MEAMEENDFSRVSHLTEPRPTLLGYYYYYYYYYYLIKFIVHIEP